MILNVLYAVADDISYVDRRINSLCVSASEAFEKGFVFNRLWIVEIAVTFLIIGIYSSLNSMLYKLLYNLTYYDLIYDYYDATAPAARVVPASLTPAHWLVHARANIQHFGHLICRWKGN